MQTLRLDQIRTDGGTQTRAGISLATVQDYADAVQDGAKFPPVTVFYDGKEHWLADGFHRFNAYRQLGLRDIEAEVQQGTRRDAVLHSVGANTSHGLRRTNDDKRRAVTTLLRDDEWSKWSNREIARRCAVDEGTVRNLRNSICGNSADGPRTVQRGGSTYTQNTANIGQRPAAPRQNLTPAPAAAPAYPPHDPETGELLTPDAPLLTVPAQVPQEVYEGGQKAVPQETEFQRFHGQLKAAGESPRAQELHSLLNRLLTFERDGADLIATPYAAGMGLNRAARAAGAMLAGWFADHPEADPQVITVDAAPLRAPTIVQIPPGLRATPGFTESWAQWLDYRRQRRLSNLPTVLDRQMEMLSKSPDPVAVIEHSITNAYNGLFEPRTPQNANAKSLNTARQTYRALTEGSAHDPF